MFQLEPHILYYFRVESWADVQQAFVDLLTQKERIMKIDPAAMSRVYQYAEILSATAKKVDENTVLGTIDREILCYLDIDLVKQFLLTPEDEAVRDVLALRLVMMAAATGNLSDLSVLHDFKKQYQFDAGLQEEDTDVGFIIGLRETLAGVGSVEEGSTFLSALQTLRRSQEPLEAYVWGEAFIIAMLMQAVWKCFVFLTESEQQTVLQNYFYHAIAVGVPVRAWLKEMYSHVTTNDLTKKLDIFISRALDYNREIIPVVSDETAGLPFVELWKQYSTFIQSQENIPALAQGKFISNLYKDDVYHESFEAWLRETLMLVFHIRKGEKL